jgi:hypothetical protein
MHTGNSIAWERDLDRGLDRAGDAARRTTSTNDQQEVMR